MYVVFEHWVQLCVNIRYSLETVEIVSSSQKVMNFRIHERFGRISRGRGTPIWKGRGARRRFWKEVLRYQDAVLWVWLEVFFHPWEDKPKHQARRVDKLMKAENASFLQHMSPFQTFPLGLHIWMGFSALWCSSGYQTGPMALSHHHQWLVHSRRTIMEVRRRHNSFRNHSQRSVK